MYRLAVRHGLVATMPYITVMLLVAYAILLREAPDSGDVGEYLVATLK